MRERMAVKGLNPAHLAITNIRQPKTCRDNSMEKEQKRSGAADPVLVHSLTFVLCGADQNTKQRQASSPTAREQILRMASIRSRPAGPIDLIGILSELSELSAANSKHKKHFSLRLVWFFNSACRQRVLHPGKPNP